MKWYWWLLIGFVLYLVLRKRKSEQNTQGAPSASVNSPADNLVNDLQGSEKASALVTSIAQGLVGTVQKQDTPASSAPIVQSTVTEGDFIKTVIPETEKILSDPAKSSRRQRENNWWPYALHENRIATATPDELQNLEGKDFSIEPCGCGCGNMKIIHRQ